MDARYLRQQDAVNMDRLAKLPVTLIGAGSIGSVTALWLGKMGVSDLTIYDDDLVQEHNWSNQMFSEADIGRPKVEALRDVMDSFCSFTPRAVNYPYKDQPLSEVVIATVDSMTARKAIWKSVRQQSQVRFYIDARMGLETLRVFALNPAIREHRIAYSQSLYSDSGALQEPCTARTISYTPLMAAAVICNQVKRYVNDEEIVGQVVMDLVTYAALKL